MIYFTSDLHLGHANIIKLSNRPFETLEEMDEVLVQNWNKKVKKNDTIYILGDLIHKSSNPVQYLQKLNGVKHLILGNHDHTWLCKVSNPSDYFASITPMLITSQCNHLMTMCHYPMLEWNGSRRESSPTRLGYLLYGHIHNKTTEQNKDYEVLFRKNNALNVGVDINNYQPVTFEELVANNQNFRRKIGFEC